MLRLVEQREWTDDVRVGTKGTERRCYGWNRRSGWNRVTYVKASGT